MQTFQGSRLLNLGGRNFNCMGDEVVCTDPDTGKELWKHKLEGDLKKQGGFLAAPPAAAGGQVFLATLQGEVLQMDPAAGKVAKTYKLGAPTRFQPIIEGGRIYVGTLDGKVVCIFRRKVMVPKRSYGEARGGEQPGRPEPTPR